MRKDVDYEELFSRNQYVWDVIETALKLYAQGWSYSRIARFLEVSITSVSNWISKAKENGFYEG